MKSRKTDGRATQRSIIIESFIKNNPELLKKEGGWKRTAAQILHNRYPDIFPSIDAARDSIRFQTQANGSYKRQQKKVFFDYSNPENLAKESPWEKPFILPSGLQKLAIFGDIHGVFLDQSAIDAAVNIAVDKGCKALLLNGDLMDNHWFGRHKKLLGTPMLYQELDVIKKLLDFFKKHFDQIWFKLGNHDAWISRFVSTDSPQFENIDAVTVGGLIGLNERGIVQVHNLQEIKLGDLTILHGHEKPGHFSPKYVAKSVAYWWQQHTGQLDSKILVNHWHIIDECKERQIDGSFVRGYVNGCLCNMKPEYNPFSRWQQGLAVAEQKVGITNVELIEV